MQAIRIAALTLTVLASGLANAGIQDVVTTGARNVVLVHGSYVDGSTWRSIHDQLWLKGYTVTVVQQPNTSLAENVAATREAIDSLDGPVVLVGQDAGGAVISIAGASDKVKALVYVAAYQPEIGESVAQLDASRPSAKSAVKFTRDGRQFIDHGKFSDVFAADVPPNRSNFMTIAQTKVPRQTLEAPVWAAAWHAKPSYAIVATEDRLVNPDLQRWMYKRAGAKVTEIKGSHALQFSQPEAVARVVIEAAQNAK